MRVLRPEQFLSPERELRELGCIRAVTLITGQRTIDVVTRRSALKSRILAASGVETSGWERLRISLSAPLPGPTAR